MFKTWSYHYCND